MSDNFLSFHQKSAGTLFFLRSDFCQNLIYYFIGTAMIEVFPPKAVLRKSRKFPNVISSFHAFDTTRKKKIYHH